MLDPRQLHLTSPVDPELIEMRATDPLIAPATPFRSDVDDEGAMLAEDAEIDKGMPLFERTVSAASPYLLQARSADCSRSLACRFSCSASLITASTMT